MKGRLFALLFLFLLLSAPTFDITSDQQFSNNKFRNRLAGFDSPCTDTNYLRFSETISNAVWVKNGLTSAAPIVTDNYNSETGVTRLQLAATVGAGNASDVYQKTTTSPAGDITSGVLVKGNGTSGTIDVCRFNSITWTCNTCAYNSTTYTLCSPPSASGVSTGTYYLQYGNPTYHSGNLRPAQDILVKESTVSAGTTLGCYQATN